MAYNQTNNWHAVLATAITESSTTIILGGTYETLPTSNFIAKLSKYTLGVLAGRETVYITARTGTTCTGVIRAFEAVPVTDSTNALVQQPLPFSADDILECVVSWEFLSKLSRTSTENWVYIAKDGTESILEGLEGQVVGFDADDKPTVFYPTVDITSLTEATSISGSEYYVINDGVSNKKVLATKINWTQDLTVVNITTTNSTSSSQYFSRANLSYTYNPQFNPGSAQTNAIQLSRDNTTWTTVDTITYGWDGSGWTYYRHIWFFDGWFYVRVTWSGGLVWTTILKILK
jgi:hypothetical protein